MNVLHAKSILYAYPNLETIATQIDELVMKRALGSMSDFSPAIEQYERIIDLTEQKTVLFELEILTEKILKTFSKEEIDCLDYKYFKGKPKEYYSNFDSSSRNYFRRQVRVAQKFADRLEKLGFTDRDFEEKCLKIDFFKQLLKRVKEHEELCNKNKPVEIKKAQCPQTLQRTEIKKSA